jgi:hypothetical protein
MEKREEETDDGGNEISGTSGLALIQVSTAYCHFARHSGSSPARGQGLPPGYE